jgi:hypothetical protein
MRLTRLRDIDTDGKASVEMLLSSDHLSPHEIIDRVLGDPQILMRCRLLSRDELVIIVTEENVMYLGKVIRKIIGLERIAIMAKDEKAMIRKEQTDRLNANIRRQIEIEEEQLLTEEEILFIYDE